MKIYKIILFCVFFVLGLNNSLANNEQITLNFPVGGNINLSAQNMLFSGNDVEQDGITNTALGTATRLCELLGNYSFKNYTLVGFDTQILTGTTTRYYYRSTFNTFSFNSTNNVISSVTCEYESEKQIIIDSNPGINKEIFDSETIEEFYKIQATLMIFILFFYFFYRLLKQNSAPRNIFKRK